MKSEYEELQSSLKMLRENQLDMMNHSSGSDDDYFTIVRRTNEEISRVKSKLAFLEKQK